MENNTVAETILAQVNASDFWARARWGVKEILSTDTGLQFNCNKKIKILINLDASTDTYSIEIGRLVGRFDYKQVGSMDLVQASELVEAIHSLFSKAFGTL